MAFQLKYYYSYRDTENNQYWVNIQENSESVLVPMEIRGFQNPFVVQYPEIVNKFQPVRGSGAVLNLLSETDRQFIGLYTADMQQYKVNHYLNSTLNWTGFLDSELYSESFNELDNYPVSFAANDGFNLLDRINYVNDSGVSYTGIQSQWTVLTNIFSKLSLNWNNIYVGLSTVIDVVTLAASETLFHKTFINANNYINEDGEPETCRRVLEAILEPYGAYIQQINGSLCISDVNHIAQDTTLNFKKYNASTFAYISTDTINPNLGDLSTIKFADNNQTLDVVSGINKQVVSYSPYRLEKVIDYEPKEIDFSSEINTDTYYPGNINGWNETFYNASNHWNKSNQGSFCKLTGIAGTQPNGDYNEFYLKLAKGSNVVNLTYSKQLPYIIPATGYYLKIDLDAYVRTMDYLKKDDEVGYLVHYLYLYSNLKIGDKYLVTDINGNRSWSSTEGLFTLYFADLLGLNDSGGLDFSPINDTWFGLKKNGVYNNYKTIIKEPILIPLNTGFSGGLLEFKIKSFSCLATLQNVTTTMANVKDLRLKNIIFSITDGKGNEISGNDLEYIGYLNANFKNEGETIQLIHGTNIGNEPCERAGLMGFNGTNYYFLQNWTREGVSTKIENLLLRSVVSNYTQGSIKFSCNINMISSLLGFLTYNNFLAGKKLMIAGCTLNYADFEAEVTLIEVNQDNLTIS